MIKIPDDLHLRIQRYYQQLTGEEGSFVAWSHENQRKLLDWFFGISKENGVFILYNGNKENGIAFNVKGALGGSFLDLMNTKADNSWILAADTWDRSFTDNQELVDFKRIIQDLDGLHENKTCWTVPALRAPTG